MIGNEIEALTIFIQFVMNLFFYRCEVSAKKSKLWVEKKSRKARYRPAKVEPGYYCFPLGKPVWETASVRDAILTRFDCTKTDFQLTKKVRQRLTETVVVSGVTPIGQQSAVGKNSLVRVPRQAQTVHRVWFVNEKRDAEPG